MDEDVRNLIIIAIVIVVLVGALAVARGSIGDLLSAFMDKIRFGR